MTDSILRIGLAAARNAPSVDERLETARRFIAEAAAQDVAIVCFPEAHIPGLRGMDFPVPPPDQRRQEEALEELRRAAQAHRVAVIMGMEWESAAGMLNVAFVISRDGEVMGYQGKNQIAPEEDPYYVPAGQRQLFEIDGVPFGITICHEGWRYPESVRWAAPYYEKAMMMRSLENAIYFASVNNAMRYQESATSVIGPEGECLAYVPYGQEELLVYDIDLARASGIYARRFNPAFYPPLALTPSPSPVEPGEGSLTSRIVTRGDEPV
jgi:predicted amidohydrolase